MKVHFIAIALMGLVLGAQAGAVDLTAKNFDAEVLESGKSAFVKFLAPWYVPDARHARRSETRDRAAASFPSLPTWAPSRPRCFCRRFFFLLFQPPRGTSSSTPKTRVTSLTLLRSIFNLCSFETTGEATASR